MKLKTLIPLLAFGLLAALLARGLQLNPREIPSPLIGKAVPAFELAPLQENAAPLRQADLQGKVSLINVWASWCAPCRQEHPLLVDFARRQPQVQLLGLNYKDQRDTAQAWLKELGDPYRAIGFDDKGRVGIDFGVYGVPETFVVDRSGTIRFKHVGPITAELLRDKIEPLLKSL
ncbi:cytochrome c biogenesis protein CcmG/thiol:disulfide interchange protein DsbE [Inhella inkyongensis]|uniref:Cytochrome c biogenesis protein CcmG/thiol:disulfide interchange protein DsbE n=1 Tax=Inhella inkyongensis TaxID=392593 RepID=A0A840S626_9BURK|nr:DsbE family thiol:disulfide interchange protein [Inhella inkyongensis]MBB5205032.1 cytochrome c biogenesis protein CcmG/thiol:disulfide interchange protein DsbE [Inhella inkyongensis]